MSKIIPYINIPKVMATHLFSEHHSNTHRRVCGAVVMLIGVGFVTIMHNFNSVTIHFFSDIVGYGFHGIGLIPYITILEKQIE